MPESEPKPRLIELVAPGAGQGWKAVLKNGKAVVVHEIPVPAAEAAAAVPRLQRLAEHRHPALSPVLAWGTDPNGIWVAVEPNEGVPLGSILSRGPLTPPAAAALGAAVLSGVAALHEAGIAMGGFSASAVRITSNGDVRLAGHPAAAVRGAPSQSDLRADVRSSGMAVCAAFGVDPAGAPAPPNIPPGLVVTMRSMASGAMGPAADRAQGALREMASALLAPDRMVAAQTELALRAGGREMPPITPFLPATGAPAPGPAPARPPSGPIPWGAPAPQEPAAAGPPQPPAPAPYVAPREETPAPRAPASYDPPPRSVQTYPSLPAVPIPPPVPPAPAPAPPAPAPPAAVPTWSDAPPREPAPFEPAAPPMATNPPAAAPAVDRPPEFIPNPPQPAPAAPVLPPALPWEPAAPRWEPAAPTGPASPFDAVSPGAPSVTNPPAPSPATESRPPAPRAPELTWSPAAEVKAPEARPAEPKPPEQTWTPVAPPVWTPGPTDATSTSPPPSSAAPSSPAAARPVTVPPTPIRAPARKPAGPRPPSDRGPSERPSWLIPAIIAVVVILLLGTIGGIFLAGRGKSPGGTAQTTPSAKTSPKPSEKPSPSAPAGPLAVPMFAPSSTPPVTGVVFLPDTRCTLGGACAIDVEMSYSPAQSGPLGYTLKFFDRCTGATTDMSGRSFKPPTGFIRADPGFQTVTLPTAKSAALVALSSTPAVAASAPLLLGADTCT